MIKQAVIIALAAILTLTGCVATPPPSPSPTTSAPTTARPSPAPARYDGPGQPRLELTEVWQNDEQPLINIGRTEVVEDSLVITGWGSGPAEEESVVLELGRGTARWRAGRLPREFTLDAEDRPQARLSSLAGWAVERGTDGMLILPYHLGPCRDGGHNCPAAEQKPYREHGLVGFSLADRRQVWHTAPTRSARPRGDRPPTAGFQTYEVVGATSSTVLVTLGVAGNYFADLEWDSADRQPRTIAYDASMGREMWRREGFVAEELLVNDVVIGLERSARPGATGGVPVRVDADLGTRLWAMPAETSVRWTSVTRQGGVVAESDRLRDSARQFLVSGYGEPEPLPVPSPDGGGWTPPGHLGPLAWRVVPRSSRDGSSEGPALQAIDLDGHHTVGATALPDDAVAATLGWSDYIWVSRASGRVQAFDQTGRPRSPDLTGAVHLAGLDQVLITRPDSTRVRLLDLG